MGLRTDREYLRKALGKGTGRQRRKSMVEMVEPYDSSKPQRPMEMRLLNAIVEAAAMKERRMVTTKESRRELSGRPVLG